MLPRNAMMGVISHMMETFGFITKKGSVSLCSDLKYSNHFSSNLFNK